MFVADMAGCDRGATLVSDPATCARVWRGVAGVHAQIQETLALAQEAQRNWTRGCERSQKAVRDER